MGTPAKGPIYKCGDCGSTNLVIELPPSPWDENPDDWCFHQAPNKPPGVVGWVHPKSEPCELSLRTFLPYKDDAESR